MIHKQDLSGKWLFTLTTNQSTRGLEIDFSDTITLPATTSSAKKGEYNARREDGFLTDTYEFEGYSYYKRTVDLGFAHGNALILFLERTRISTVFMDGKEIGTQESLCAPHRYDLSAFADGEHELVIRVANFGYKTKGGHLTSRDTQTNWNGITGRIELQVFAPTHVKHATVFPDAENKSVRVHAKIVGASTGTLTAHAECIHSGTHTAPELQVSFSDNETDFIYPLGEDALLWSEYTPAVYRLSLTIGKDTYETTFGLRNFRAQGDKFTINGQKTFLRGKHDGMIFPLTGYAPTDVEGWLRVMKISQSYGMNHYRYHTCCPPEAAFLAADLLGIYMEPELPFWGTIHAEDEPDFNRAEQEFLIEEGKRMLSEFGNHPSFCMISMGNELWGSKERINEIMGVLKAHDSRPLYTQGSNNFQFFPSVLENDDFFCGVRLAKDRLIRGSYAMCDAPLGHVQADKPAANKCYDTVIVPEKPAQSAKTESGKVKIQYGTTMKEVDAAEAQADFIPDVPIVTHEIGQYETFPNFDEIEKYTGSLKSRSMELYRDWMNEKGLLELDKQYFAASGKLAVACYQEELEAAFRSEKLAGFQLLDLQDFSGQGTALVGMLDAFMDSKGLISNSEWRSFCSDAVLLAEFPGYVVTAESTFRAQLRLTTFRRECFDGKLLTWSLSDGNKLIAGSQLKISQTPDEHYLHLGEISADLPDTAEIRKLELRIGIRETDVYKNYTLWLVPNTAHEQTRTERIFAELTPEAENLLRAGKDILLVRKPAEEDSIEGTYCVDFWCYPMFKLISEMMKKPIPVGTMGLLIDNTHPALAQFTSEFYSTPQWWEIVNASRSEILDDNHEGKRFIVRTIDNFARNHWLGLIYEYDLHGAKVVVCNCDYAQLAKSPEGRQLVKSLLAYLN